MSVQVIELGRREQQISCETILIAKSCKNCGAPMRSNKCEFGHMCKRFSEWIVTGAETGNRKDKIVPKRKWVAGLADVCKREEIPLFMKDSLIPIIGEENMRREFPWG
ncbi:MAG: hypothetical protein IJ601_04485 [Acidaminococcaceae bacterium]|nr:hypothetical protein [Acidaminococcaceae bacterium]